MLRSIALTIAVALAAVFVLFFNKPCSCLAQTAPGKDSAVRAQSADAKTQPQPEKKLALPRLVDLGATKCIPCKMMAPILEELKKDYAGTFDVVFIDVWENPAEGRKYGIQSIPTQIFYDASGKELFRHEGFFPKDEILKKWKEFGVEPKKGAATAPDKTAFKRLESSVSKKDARSVCKMCEGTINPKTAVSVKAANGDAHFCGPHCYFIMLSCFTGDKGDIEKNVSVADWSGASSIPAAAAFYLYGVDGKSGRPTIKAFADKASAEKERALSGGNIIDWGLLQRKELATRCGFCDRAVYPEDAALVKADGLYTWGCCSHCAMGVAARTGKDIEVRQPDRLSGEMIVVKTAGGKVASVEPATAVAWFGQKAKADGGYASSGCFHQGFFATPENLLKWAEANPQETGEMVGIQKVLADKMALSQQQIQKACKIGECAPSK